MSTLAPKACRVAEWGNTLKPSSSSHVAGDLEHSTVVRRKIDEVQNPY